MSLVSLGHIDLEVAVVGEGEPVVLIQTALTADEFLPLANQPSLRDACQVILYHRRGYGRSSPTKGPGSIGRDASDCRNLLTALRIDRAHVVGVSYSAAVALELAVVEPSLVHTLTVIEPPPLHIPRVEEFIAANDEINREYRAHGATQALEFFLARLMGSDWRTELDRHIPGAVDQVERDADTFFTSDIPALLAWEFDANKARALHQPTLYIGGTDSGAWFAEERNVILDWLPEAEDVAIPGADHNLAVTHSQRIAGELVDFIARHPIGLSPPGTRGA